MQRFSLSPNRFVLHVPQVAQRFPAALKHIFREPFCSAHIRRFALLSSRTKRITKKVQFLSLHVRFTKVPKLDEIYGNDLRNESFVFPHSRPEKKAGIHKLQNTLKDRGKKNHERQLRHIRLNTQGRVDKRGPGATHKGDQKRRETMEGRKHKGRQETLGGNFQNKTELRHQSTGSSKQRKQKHNHMKTLKQNT